MEGGSSELPLDLLMAALAQNQPPGGQFEDRGERLEQTKGWIRESIEDGDLDNFLHQIFDDESLEKIQELAGKRNAANARLLEQLENGWEKREKGTENYKQEPEKTRSRRQTGRSQTGIVEFVHPKLKEHCLFKLLSIDLTSHKLKHFHVEMSSFVSS